MAPKGNNTKKESGRAKKAENEAKKKDAAAADKVGTHAINHQLVSNNLRYAGKKGSRAMER